MPAAQRAVIVKLLREASVEVSGHDLTAAAKLSPWLRPGADVYVNFVSGGSYRQSAEVAAAVRRAGFTPIPHVAARGIRDRAELADFLKRLGGEAAVDRVLVVAGDVLKPVGSFASSLDIIRTGLLQESGIRSVGVAGHPEGHPLIQQFALWEALKEKVALARAAGLDLSIVTQFCFEADPIVDWLKMARASGIDAPVRVGIAGPAGIATLVKFAVSCGIGNSLRTLSNRPQALGRLLTDNAPDELVRALAERLPQSPGPLPSLHFFPFGGVAKTGRWLATALKAEANYISLASSGGC
jgi:methylenetetrahydrofolate reductase (NADPH)